MNYRKLGKAGLKVSEISIGGWLTFGGSIDEKQTAHVLAAAFDAGINFVDLADIYARGQAEIDAGKALAKYTRTNLVISSKLFWPMSDDINDRGLSRKHIMESVEKTLTRLGTDYLDIYFCHRYDPDTEIEEVVRAMDDLVRQGKILYWGTSVWEAAQIDSAVSIADKFLCYRPQVEQPRYNMLDRSIEKSVLPTCARHGMGLVVWSPLAQGILTGKYNDGVPTGTRGEKTKFLDRELTDENIARVRRLGEIASDLGISIAQLALAWVLRRTEISSAITGATSPDHVRENVAASEVVLEQEVVERIDEILAGAETAHN